MAKTIDSVKELLILLHEHLSNSLLVIAMLFLILAICIVAYLARYYNNVSRLKEPKGSYAKTMTKSEFKGHVATTTAQ